MSCAYQPIVNLETGAIFGYEALARDESGNFPLKAFESARRDGTLPALDWECRGVAVRGALDAGLAPPLALFTNVEPDSIGTPMPEHLAKTMDEGQILNRYVEITERSIPARPAELLETVRTLRSRGIHIAVDDVGTDPQSLALLPVLKPDIIKLEMSLVQSRPSVKTAEVMIAVKAHADDTGALILAEGVENEEHLEMARMLGATLGQGWYFGFPGPLPQGEPMKRSRPARSDFQDKAISTTPAAIIERSAELSPGRKNFLDAVSRYLEDMSLKRGRNMIVVSSFQDAHSFQSAARRRYAELAEMISLTVVLGVGMPAEPAPGVIGGRLEPGDALADEWTVAILGPQAAVALVGRDLGDGGAEADRRFDFGLTFDRQEVTEIVTSMLARVTQDVAVSLPLVA